MKQSIFNIILTIILGFNSIESNAAAAAASSGECGSHAEEGTFAKGWKRICEEDNCFFDKATRLEHESGCETHRFRNPKGAPASAVKLIIDESGIPFAVKKSRENIDKEAFVYMITSLLGLDNVARVEEDLRITLSPKEHSDYKWCDFKEAYNLLQFSGQRDCLQCINQLFVKSLPNKLLEV